MEPELLQGVEEELAAFKAKENRPFWPNSPTPCPVEGCTDQLYSSHASFMRHWSAHHEQEIAIFSCPNCGRVFNRRDNARKHQRTAHKMSSDIQSSQQHNRNYVDPRGSLPYVQDHRARLSMKRAATVPTADILVSEEAVCRDEVVTYNRQGQCTGKKFKSS